MAVLLSSLSVTSPSPPSLLSLPQKKRQSSLPIVGNLFQLGSEPHAALASLGLTYGSLFSLRFGTQRIIVASSASAAALVLKTHDLIISSRSAAQMCRFEFLPYSMIWSDCNDSWKRFRATCRSLLFSSKMINGGASLRQQKVANMVGGFRSDEGKEVCILELVFGTIFGMMAVGQTVHTYGEKFI